MGNDLSSPLDICVLIPCHNNIEGLIQSISSIVYDYQRFLVLVVDDGSSIEITRNILYQHLPIYVNIQVIRLEQNQGITSALNNGLEFIYANYKALFVARLDCGDTCDAERFYRQIDFMEEHPQIDLLGTWCYFKNKDTGFTYQYITPITHDSIKRSLYFRNVFVHPTVMWRVSTIKQYRYPYIYPHAEDYGLFYDIMSERKTAIVDKFLVTCEINKTGISFTNRAAQLKSRLSVIWHFGKNKLLLLAGVIKLTVLMILPYQFITRIKKQIYRPKPGL